MSTQSLCECVLLECSVFTIHILKCETYAYVRACLCYLYSVCACARAALSTDISSMDGCNTSNHVHSCIRFDKNKTKAIDRVLFDWFQLNNALTYNPSTVSSRLLSCGWGEELDDGWPEGVSCVDEWLMGGCVEVWRADALDGCVMDAEMYYVDEWTMGERCEDQTDACALDEGMMIFEDASWLVEGSANPKDG